MIETDVKVSGSLRLGFDIKATISIYKLELPVDFVRQSYKTLSYESLDLEKIGDTECLTLTTHTKSIGDLAHHVIDYEKKLEKLIGDMQRWHRQYEKINKNLGEGVV